ncbi:unnamed protein product [Heligmosomoides polygyrus]|uniref:G_PROTEIN_RECEP_F1_2 domain-containing protein n=1 Tax=Heligmosomoides polygyrus TaxID=6339 RepID=A0A183GPC7_HELPZ|nr:unnamed protein product [Heligmosomoides polygyrus]
MKVRRYQAITLGSRFAYISETPKHCITIAFAFVNDCLRSPILLSITFVTNTIISFAQNIRFVFAEVCVRFTTFVQGAKMAMAFKSIFVTVSIVICGWMVTFLVNSLAVVVSQNAYIIMVINMYAGITVNIGTMSNVFVFVAINTEYREVIQQMFGFRPHAKKMSEVSTMQGLSEKSRSKGIVAVHS